MICNLLLIKSSFAQTDYYVCFFGEKISSSAIVGHAFIGIGKGTPLTCDIYGEETEMIGFYPKVRTEGGKSLWFGPVDGSIRNDIKTELDSYIFRRIDFANYINIKLRIEQWKNKKYQLTRQDCISFFIDVASLVSNIELPDRSKYTLPDQYVKEFIIKNKN